MSKSLEELKRENERLKLEKENLELKAALERERAAAGQGGGGSDPAPYELPSDASEQAKAMFRKMQGQNKSVAGSENQLYYAAQPRGKRIYTRDASRARQKTANGQQVAIPYHGFFTDDQLI